MTKGSSFRSGQAGGILLRRQRSLMLSTAVTHVEAADQRVHIACAIVQGLASGRGFLYQAGILVRDLIQLRDRLVNLVDTRRLLFGRSGNFRYVASHFG